MTDDEALEREIRDAYTNQKLSFTYPTLCRRWDGWLAADRARVRRETLIEIRNLVSLAAVHVADDAIIIPLSRVLTVLAAVVVSDAVTEGGEPGE